MPPEPSLTLSEHGKRDIRCLQNALDSPALDDLIRLFRMIDADADLSGLHLVLPRLARVMPWLDVLWAGPADRYAGLSALAAALCRPEVQARWRDAVPLNRSSRSNVSNVLTGRLDQYPHYALYTEFLGDRSGDQDARVAPLIALYTLLSNAGSLTRTLADKASRRIRRLLNPSNAEARALRVRFPQVKPDAEVAWELFEVIARPVPAVAKLVDLARQSLPQKQLRQRSSPKIHRRLRIRPLPGGPSPPGIRVKSKPGPPNKVPGGSTSPGKIAIPPSVIEIPKGSALEPALALRKWSAWSELQHQYLFWQWRTLNPPEIDMIRGALARLLEARDPLGLLLGLSLATARDAVDVLALRLRNPQSQTTDPREADADYWLDPNTGVMVHATALPQSSYVPDPAACAVLLPVAERVRIALPPTLVDACRTHLPSVPAGSPTLGEALGLKPDVVKARVMAWCADLRRNDPRVRISPARLREWPIARALYLSRDIALVAHLFLLEIPGSAILYYASFPSARLQSLHVDVMAEVFDGEALRACDEPPIGSRLALRPEALRAWIVRWQQDLSTLSQTRSLNALTACHNALVRYTLALLMRWSGHRAVNDPFDAWHRFDAPNGTVLIADKETGDATQARLAWLPPLAFEQLEAYRAHLQALSGRIAPFDPVLAERIARAGDATSDLSLFFVLDVEDGAPVPSMVTPSTLQAALALPVPLYFGRNERSRTLRTQGLEAEYVEYQLNHVQQGQDLLGRWSTLRVAEVGAALIPLLAQGAAQEGWSVLRGVRAYPAKPGAQALPQVSWMPGPLQRARDRIARRRALTRRLREVLQQAAPPRLWDRAAVDALAAALRAAFPQPIQCRAAFRLARRWVLRQHPEARRALERGWPQLLDVSPPPGPFRLDDALHLHAYRRCRASLRSGLLGLSEDAPMAAWDGALLACALLEDCVLAEAMLAQLPRAARTQAFTSTGIAWVDLAESAYDPPATRRLFLTPLTGLLVIRLRQAHAQRSSSFNVAAKAAVAHVLPTGTWEHLCAIAAAGARYRLSGVEYRYALGELTAASLPVTALLRLCTGRLVTASPVEPLPEVPRHGAARTRPASRPEPDYQRGLRYRAALRRHLHAVVAQQARLADPRRQLSRFLDRIEPGARNTAPPVISALIHWVRRLLEQGRTKHSLGLSSIRDDYLGIARYLYEAAWAIRDFASLEEEDLEEIYRETLDATTRKQRPATAELLHDFHKTLRECFPGTPSIDLHDIEPGLKGRSVRSNLLTLDEYARARQQLDLPERVALTALYRLGLRLGELRRLGPNDLWLDAVKVLYVRSRRGAKTKTAAGQRQIPLAGRLSEEEAAEIDQILAWCRDSGIPRLWLLMPRDALVRITTAIREASGDYTLVPYHLRHAARTQMLLWANTDTPSSMPGAAPPAPLLSGPEAFRRLHFGTTVPTRRSGYQEAVVAGHASPATTYGTYMHLLDWICHQAVLCDHLIDDTLLAQLSRLRPDNVRQIRRRSAETVGRGRAVLVHVLKQGGLPAPPQWADMIKVGDAPSSVLPKRQRACSLREIAEVLRLSAGGQPIAVIAQRLDYAPSMVEQWVEAAEQITRQSGYPIAALSRQRSVEGLDLDVIGQALTELMSDPATPAAPWWTRHRELWCQRYIHRLDMPYFSDVDELTIWIRGLLRLRVESGAIRLMAPLNVSGEFLLAATTAVRTLGVEASQVRRQYRSVNARSAAASRDPGIGVYATQGPGRQSLAKALARWMYCAIVVDRAV